MTIRPRVLALATAFLAAALIGPVGPVTAGDVGRDASRLSTPKVLHRVAWTVDKLGRRGIHLRSARINGTDVRRIYDTRRGFTLQLTMDQRGRRLAFAPCCRNSFGLIVVVPVLGGEAMRPLAAYPEFDFVGGIGWSPNGRRLAFEGARTDGDVRTHGIWTVRLDGTDLRKVLALPSPSEGSPSRINDALAWTQDGILYSDGADLRSARDGQSRQVIPGVTSVRLTGDRRHIVVVARTGRDLGVASIAEPDGSHARRLVNLGSFGSSTAYYDVTPNYDGTRVMASRYVEDGTGETERALITWNIADGPRSATVLDFLDATLTHTWN